MPQLIDTTVISNFAAVERLDLLRVALADAYIAVAVYTEIQHGVQDGYESLRAVEAHTFPIQPDGWIRLTEPESDEERDHYARLAAVIHAGEAESLAIAAHRGWTFVTDGRGVGRNSQGAGSNPGLVVLPSKGHWLRDEYAAAAKVALHVQHDFD